MSLSGCADTLKIWHFSQFVGWQVGEQQKNSTVKPHHREADGWQTIEKSASKGREKVVRKGNLFGVNEAWMAKYDNCTYLAKSQSIHELRVSDEVSEMVLVDEEWK